MQDQSSDGRPKGSDVLSARDAVKLLGCASLILLALWALLLPFRYYPENAPQSKALNNARQLAIATQSYMDDYAGHLPGWTRINGQLYHNVWDEQIDPNIKSRDVYYDGQGCGIRSPSQPPPQNRILSYGLNGLLIAKPRVPYDGNADWRPRTTPITVEEISDPAGTILFAELATEKPMGAPYGNPVAPAARSSVSGGTASEAYTKALYQWIDIDPRAWVETSGPSDSYDARRWDASRGVARALYGRAGASYAFMDGHVQFFKIGKTVGLGQDGVTTANAWAPENVHNLWNPDR